LQARREAGIHMVEIPQTGGLMQEEEQDRMRQLDALRRENDKMQDTDVSPIPPLKQPGMYGQPDMGGKAPMGGFQRLGNNARRPYATTPSSNNPAYARMAGMSSGRFIPNIAPSTSNDVLRGAEQTQLAGVNMARTNNQLLLDMINEENQKRQKSPDKFVDFKRHRAIIRDRERHALMAKYARLNKDEANRKRGQINLMMDRQRNYNDMYKMPLAKV